MGILRKVLAAGADKDLRRYRSLAQRCGELEARLEGLGDSELQGLCGQLRRRARSGEPLDAMMPQAFALVREASRRVLGMRHFDVQLMAGAALHEGRVAELMTGQGKTLVATLPAFLDSLAGRGVHLVTVNDYLAARDAADLGPLYRFLGMSVGVLQAATPPSQRRNAYSCDVVYGTNSEFGFDYLRDNMATDGRQRVQRGHDFAIVDEVDSILIDEARTPLIVSGPGASPGDTFARFAAAVEGLAEGVDFDLDEARRQVAPTDEGLRKIEARLGGEGVFDDESGLMPNHLLNALKARYLLKRDVDYVVGPDGVSIVDEFTGRTMEGRRWSDGLHQAVEAREGLEVKADNQTLASVTLQNYFKLYGKLAGMTGTAATEDAELRETYGLEVVVVPPNRPVARQDLPDLVFSCEQAKLEAVVADVAGRHAAGQPVLVGTSSVEASERLSAMLRRQGVPHSVLNAKEHAREAAIVAQAGRLGAVTVATNMAGRGTDIMLGGNPKGVALDYLAKAGIDPAEATEEQMGDALGRARLFCAAEKQAVEALGGLAVIGTERHESRRIDNQLRGRSGRQGDPGCSRFYLSLEDDLLRLFGEDRMDRLSKVMEASGAGTSEPIESGAVCKAVEAAQRKVEDRNRQARKHVLDYDEVMDLQRRAVYAMRDRVMDGRWTSEQVEPIVESASHRHIAPLRFAEPDDRGSFWDLEAAEEWLHGLTGVPKAFLGVRAIASMMPSAAVQAVADYLGQLYANKAGSYGERSEQIQRSVMLKVIDSHWTGFLADMDYLKTGVGLRAFGQRDPLAEYKEEAHAAFERLLDSIQDDYLRTFLRLDQKTAPLPVARAAGQPPRGDAAATRTVAPIAFDID